MAVALAVALKADLCEILKDVDGVCTADPRRVKPVRGANDTFCLSNTLIRLIQKSLVAEISNIINGIRK